MSAVLSCLALTAFADADAIKKGTDWLAEKEKEEGVQKLPSGMLFKVLNPGTGPKSPKVSDPCDVHYRGYLPDGTVFDSSYDRGQPATFAPDQVIRGWTEALQMMCEGEKWWVGIPYNLAYGERGMPPRIPGYSPLQFEIEVITVKGKGKKCATAKKALNKKLGVEPAAEAAVQE